MAGAEARAVWQRTTSRYFVQEDAKRAPKLAWYPSAPPSSKQVDVGPTNVPDGQEDNLPVGFLPLNPNNSYSNLTPDSKWWLKMQPNYGCQRGLMNEHLNNLEAEMEAFITSSTFKRSRDHLQNEIDGTRVDDEMYSNYSSDPWARTPATCIKKDLEVKKKELKDMDISYELLEMDLDGCTVSKKASELRFDSESPCGGVGKAEPWWRTTDTYELASLVAQRSLNPIENCDLPRPQNSRLKRDPYANLECFGHDGILPSVLDQNAQADGHPCANVNTRSNLAFGRAYAKQVVSLEGQPQQGSIAKTRKICNPTPKCTSETKISESDPCKAQLLEALCHSQTRAREAEKAAKQAYEEKEHIVKLFFKQASQLFAYKQWLQLLQLENLYFQIKNNNHSLHGLFPVALPSRPRKTRKVNGKRGKQNCPIYDIGKFAFAFALGLSLVSAGLLLGWTVGWMLPII